MKRAIFLMVILGLVISLGMLGCGNKPKEIKIGVIQPLTGDLANFGKTVVNGIQMAVDDFSKEYPEIKINLRIEDSQSKPAVAVSALNKLLDIDGVRIVIGTLTSSGTLAMAPIAQEKKVILMSPTASNPALSKAGPYFYRVWTSDDFDGRVAAQYCYTKLQLKRAGVIYLNNDYGLGLKNIFENTFKELGGDVIIVDYYEEQERDFRTIISKLKTENLDVIYLPGHPYGIGTILKQARELGINTTYFSNVAAEDKEFLTVAGNTAAGLYFTAPAFDISSDDPKTKKFIHDYRTRFNDEPDVHAVKGYDAASTLLSGIGHGFLTPDQLKSYIDSKEAFSGISGDFSFDENGDVVTAVSVKRYREDESIEILEFFEPTIPTNR